MQILFLLSSEKGFVEKERKLRFVWSLRIFLWIDSVLNQNEVYALKLELVSWFIRLQCFKKSGKFFGIKIDNFNHPLYGEKV